jgi:hypothetical protein
MTTGTTLDRRGLLLAAATMLAERVDPLAVTETELAAAVGVSAEEFADEFDGVEGYLAAVQMRFFEGRLNNVISKAGTMLPGLDRMRAAWSSYLDYSVQHAGLFVWCRRARQRFPAMQEEVRRRNHGVLLMIQMEFSTLGCAHPMESARLAVGMVLETVKMETEMRARNDAMRAQLWAALELFART